MQRRAAGCARCAHAHALRRRQAVDLALDGKQRIDAPDRFAGDRRLVDPGQIEELAPRMGPTGGLDNWPCLAVDLVEAIESGIGIRLHQSVIAGQMLLGMRAAMIARIEQHRRRRIGAGKRPVAVNRGAPLIETSRSMPG